MALPADQPSVALHSGDLQTLISTLNNILVAIGALNRTINTANAAIFPQVTNTSATATAGAATLPANPLGFMTVNLPNNGGTVKVPYYSP